MSDIKNLRFGVCDVCLKPICQCPKPTAPHALTREQVVDKLVDKFLAWPLPDSVCSDLCATKQGYPCRSGTTLLAAHEAKKMFEHVLTELFEALAQQAQEIERLEGVCLDRLRSGQRLADENILLRQSLAAMMAERDKEWADSLVNAIPGLCFVKADSPKEFVKVALATLQATLAEREHVIQQQEATIRGYRHSVDIMGRNHDDRKAERDTARQDAVRLREALQFYADPQTYGISGGTVDRIIQDAGKQAQKALKGA